MTDHTRDVLLLLERIDVAIADHQRQSRDPDPRETERLQRWRRELLLQLADSRRATWGD